MADMGKSNPRGSSSLDTFHFAASAVSVGGRSRVKENGRVENKKKVG